MKRLLMLLVAVCVVFALMPLTERAKTEKTEKPDKSNKTETAQTQKPTEKPTEKPEETKVKLPERTADFSSISTSLGGNIAMNFYVLLSDDMLEDPDAFIRFSYSDKRLEVPLQDGVEAQKNGNTVYLFTCPIAAKNINDEITAQVYKDFQPVGDPKIISVAAYCNWVVANYQEVNTVKLMEAILNYGASAQQLFDYRTDALANAALGDPAKVLAKVDAAAYAHSLTGTEAGIRVASYTLVLESETTIRCYFQLTGSKAIDQYTFTVDGVEVEPVFKDGRYYIEKTDIPAHLLDEMYVFTCGGITIRYSALSYVNQVMNHYTEGAAFNTASALYAYAKAAEAYIG